MRSAQLSQAAAPVAVRRCSGAVAAPAAGKSEAMISRAGRTWEVTCGVAWPVAGAVPVVLVMCRLAAGSALCLVAPVCSG